MVDYNNPNDRPVIDYDQSKVPQSIKSKANGVRDAKYGRQNKEFLAQAVEVAGLIANEALEAQAYDGNSLADVTLAKDGLPTLDARIRRDVDNLENKKADKAEVTAQLAHTRNHLEEKKTDKIFSQTLENRLNGVIAGLTGEEEFYTPIGLEQYMTTQGQEWSI